MHEGDAHRASVAFNIRLNPAPSHIEESPLERINYAIWQGVHRAEKSSHGPQVFDLAGISRGRAPARSGKG